MPVDFDFPEGFAYPIFDASVNNFRRVAVLSVGIWEIFSLRNIEKFITNLKIPIRTFNR